MVSLETLEFNLKHGRNYSDTEYAGRLKDAAPFRIFQLLGGARQPQALTSEYGDLWIGVLRKARNVTGSDDPNVIDGWVENQYRSIMGLEPTTLPTEQSMLGGTQQGAPTSLLGD